MPSLAPILRPPPVAHPVVAREVRRRLRRRDHVVGRQRVLGVRQRDVDDLRAGVAQHLGALAARAPRSRRACRRPGTPSGCRSACRACRPSSAASKSGTGRSAEVEVLRIVPGHRPQHDRRVAHRLGHRPGLVERRGEGDDPPARAAPVGRLHPDDAGEAPPAAGSSRRCRSRSPRGRGPPPPPPPTRPDEPPGVSARRRRRAATGSPPGRRPRSRSSSPWRTRPC